MSRGPFRPALLNSIVMSYVIILCVFEQIKTYVKSIPSTPSPSFPLLPLSPFSFLLSFPSFPSPDVWGRAPPVDAGPQLLPRKTFEIY